MDEYLYISNSGLTLKYKMYSTMLQKDDLEERENDIFVTIYLATWGEKQSKKMNF